MTHDKFMIDKQLDDRLMIGMSEPHQKMKEDSTTNLPHHIRENRQTIQHKYSVKDVQRDLSSA